MAEEVRQVIGIDVSQAIQAVDQLQQRLDQFGQSLNNLASQMNKFSGAAKNALNFGDVNKELAQTGKILDQFGNPIKNIDSAAEAATKLGEAAGRAGQQIGNSFGGRVASALQNIATRFGRVGQAAATLGTRGVSSIRAMTTATTNFINRSAAGLGRVSGGFATISRVLTTQAIVRSLSAIQGAFQQAVTSAIDFQRTIAEITTLGEGGFFNSFDNAANAVRRLSDEFNAPIGEVGEGLYQVISNQIQGAANQVDVLTESLRLSKAGIADVGASVNLVTGTINAFQLAQSDADRVSAVFFKTVELGRTRIEALANTFGTVAPLAGEAGVRFEELAAAFSTLTINGVETAKAGTQLRGIVNALLKPTDALKQVFEEAGFASGEVALESLGLVGTLQLLDNAAGGSAERMSQLVPRIRGLAGAQILARDGAAKLAANLKQTEEAARDLADQKVQIIFDTPAEQVTKAINEIKNALTVDLGQAILGVAATIQEFTGFFTKISGLVKVLTPLIIALGVAFATYGTITLAVAVANKVLASSFIALFTAANTSILGILGALGLVAAAGVAAAVAIDRGADQAAQQSADQAVARAKKAADEIFKDQKKSINDRLNAEKTRIREETKLLQESLADTRAALARRTEIFRQENEKIAKDTQRVFDLIKDANSDLISNLQQERESAIDAATSAEERAADRRASLSDLQFGFENKRFNAIQRTANLEERASILGQQAAEKLASARTEEEIAAAQAIATRAEGFQQEALALAEQTGNRALIAQLQGSSVSLAQKLIRAEEQQAQLQRQRAAELKKIEAQEKARVTQLNEQINKAVELQAKLKFGDETVDRSAIIKELSETLGAIDQLSIPASGKLNASDIFAFAEFKKDIIEGVGQLELEGVDVQKIVSGEAIRDFEVRFAQAVADATTEGLRKALEAGVDVDIVRQAAGQQTTDAPFAALDALVAGVNQERDRQLAIAENSALIAQASIEMKEATLAQAAIIDRNVGLLESFRGASGQVVGKLSESVEGLIQAAQLIGGRDADSLGLTATQAQPQLEQLQQDVLEASTRIQQLPEAQAQALLDSLNQRIEQFRGRLLASAKQSLSVGLTTLDQQVADLDGRIQSLNDRGLLTQEQIQQRLEGVQNVGAAANQQMQGVATASQTFSTAAGTANQSLQQGAQAAATINQQLTNAAQQQLNFGGTAGGARIGRFFPRFLTGGGFSPRGTDTVPAMLSPGEFVVNARSTRRFFTQLQAINAGRQPVYRQDGGPVTNVGDINVTVSAQKEAASTGRQIARSIRRELRRGTSSL